VIAGDDDRLPVGPEPRSHSPDHRLGDLHRLLGASLQQLDRVAEQYQPVDAVDREQQPLQRRGPRQHAVTQPRPEMEVGDDESPQDAPP